MWIFIFSHHKLPHCIIFFIINIITALLGKTISIKSPKCTISLHRFQHQQHFICTCKISTVGCFNGSIAFRHKSRSCQKPSHNFLFRKIFLTLLVNRSPYFFRKIVSSLLFCNLFYRNRSLNIDISIAAASQAFSKQYCDTILLLFHTVLHKIGMYKIFHVYFLVSPWLPHLLYIGQHRKTVFFCFKFLLFIINQLYHRNFSFSIFLILA